MEPRQQHYSGTVSAIMMETVRAKVTIPWRSPTVGADEHPVSLGWVETELIKEQLQI